MNAIHHHAEIGAQPVAITSHEMRLHDETYWSSRAGVASPNIRDMGMLAGRRHY